MCMPTQSHLEKKKKKKGVGMEEIIPDPILHVLVTV